MDVINRRLKCEPMNRNEELIQPEELIITGIRLTLAENVGYADETLLYRSRLNAPENHLRTNSFRYCLRIGGENRDQLWALVTLPARCF